MSETAISVSALSKRYYIGNQPERYRTLRDIITSSVVAPLRRLRAALPGHAQPHEQSAFWALKDLSFEIKRGEVVGVIGRNGAGKSTLLKILSRITDPTTGYAEIHGRVGSLLEVGTGFHLELTGRENIFLNGAILGMKRYEIERKFDQIVEFSEVDKFIDTPVKHYSSGMHLRLAFSVAAHLEPEILLVDEVLAVGDAAFQKKCLGKMENVAATGRTVLFVSHNLGAIKELCQTSIVLTNGQLSFRGPVAQGLAWYSESLLTSNDEAATTGNSGWRQLRLNSDSSESKNSEILNHAQFTAEATLELRGDFNSARLFCIINDAMGELVVHQRIDHDQLRPGKLLAGRYQVRVALPPLWLAPGVYTLYFKFIGTTSQGASERYLSERAMLDITGDFTGIGNARLAPPLDWQLMKD